MFRSCDPESRSSALQKFNMNVRLSARTGGFVSGELASGLFGGIAPTNVVVKRLATNSKSDRYICKRKGDSPNSTLLKRSTHARERLIRVFSEQQEGFTSAIL